MLTYWATLSLGAVVASLNGWWTGPELSYGIELSAPKVLFADDKRLDRIRATRPPDGLVMDSLAALFGKLGTSAEVAAELPEVEIAEDDPAVILFTSGTHRAGRAAPVHSP